MYFCIDSSLISEINTEEQRSYWTVLFGLEVFREEATAVYPPAHLSGLSHNKWLLFFHSAWTLEFQWVSSQGHCVLAFMILQTAISELSVCACPSYGNIASASWTKSIDSSQWELEHAVLVSPLLSRIGCCLSIFNGVCCCLAVLVLYRLLLPFPDLWHLYFSQLICFWGGVISASSQSSWWRLSLGLSLSSCSALTQESWLVEGCLVQVDNRIPRFSVWQTTLYHLIQPMALRVPLEIRC